MLSLASPVPLRLPHHLGGLRAHEPFYDPRPEGLSVRSWVEEIVHLLAGGSTRTADRTGLSRSRRQALAVARRALAGTHDPISSARERASLQYSVGVDADDPDFTRFVGIASEADSLPVESELGQWETEALARLEPERARGRQWAMTYGREALESVVRRFGGAR